MAKLLNVLQENIEGAKEADSVSEFLARFAKDGNTEELFLAAVRDTRQEGFREGMKAALKLFSEIHGADKGVNL